MKTCYVYILPSQRNETLYIGLTNDIERRIAQHKNKIFKGFTEKYNVNILVYLEEHETYGVAAMLEEYKRKKKKYT